MGIQFLRRAQILELTGLSYSTIYRLERLGRFPKRRKLGDWSVGWVETEVENWLSNRLEVAVD